VPVEADLVFKTRDQVETELAPVFQAAFPDVDFGPESVARIWIRGFSTTAEGIFLAMQVVHDDLFPQTASALALMRQGEVWGRPRLNGTLATGTVRFTGVGGTIIPAGTLVAAIGATEEALRFTTNAPAQIPAPGIPTAPVTTDGGVGVLSAGTYEYVVTFSTVAGMTAYGASSTPLVLSANRQVSLNSIPIGGPGTTGRSIYRRVNGGAYQFVVALGDNTATSYTDNIATGSLGGSPPTDSTAEGIDVFVTAEDAGTDFNVVAGTVTEMVDAVTGVTSVANALNMVGGTVDEELEVFRSKLLEWIQAPKSGAPRDLKAWAESVPGVGTATVFSNDNLGVSAPGHATVRIAAPDGSVPDASVISDVIDELISHDIANITIHVGTFNPRIVNVSVTILPSGTFALSDVSASVTDAIDSYISGVPVGGTVYRSGIIAAVFGLPGVESVTVTTPAADIPTVANEKASTGTVTVS
jgi:uncharacterized phage protein gp47/JayE